MLYTNSRRLQCGNSGLAHGAGPSREEHASTCCYNRGRRIGGRGRRAGGAGASSLRYREAPQDPTGSTLHNRKIRKLDKIWQKCVGCK